MKDRIVLGDKINEIKFKNGLDLMGQRIQIVPKWREGFWEVFPHEAKQNHGWFQMREAPKTPRVFLLNENNQIQKNTFERRRIQKKSFQNFNTKVEKERKSLQKVKEVF